MKIKKQTIVQESLRPVPSEGMVEQANKHASFRPQQSYLGNALRPPKSEVAEEAPDEGYN